MLFLAVEADCPSDLSHGFLVPFPSALLLILDSVFSFWFRNKIREGNTTAVENDPDPGNVSARSSLRQKDDDDVNKNADDEKKETGNNAEKMQDDNVKQEEKEDTETEADEKKEDYLDDKAEEAKEIPNTNAKRKLEEIKESRMKENGCKLFRKFVIEI